MPGIELNIQNILLVTVALIIISAIALIRAAGSERRKQRRDYKKFNQNRSNNTD